VQGRTPLDLLTWELRPYLAAVSPVPGVAPPRTPAELGLCTLEGAKLLSGDSAERATLLPAQQQQLHLAATSVFCWGSGSNYQLGTGGWAAVIGVGSGELIMKMLGPPLEG
jgi:hypothetical protein